MPSPKATVTGFPSTRRARQNGKAVKPPFFPLSSAYDFPPFARIGSDRRHAVLTSALDVALNVRLVGTPCQAVVADLRVSAPETGATFLPDVVVFCEERYDDGALLTPMVLIEILSPETQTLDRGDKFADCRTISSLRHYLLVSSDRILVDHYARKGSDSWLLTTYRARTDVLRLDPPGVEMPLEEIYRRSGL